MATATKPVNAVPDPREHPELAAVIAKQGEVAARLAQVKQRLADAREELNGARERFADSDDIGRIIDGEEPVGPDPLKSLKDRITDAKHLIDALEGAQHRLASDRSAAARKASRWAGEQAKAEHLRLAQAFVDATAAAIDAATALDDFVSGREAEQDYAATAAFAWTNWWPHLLNRLSRRRSPEAHENCARVLREGGPDGLDVSALERN